MRTVKRWGGVRRVSYWGGIADYGGTNYWGSIADGGGGCQNGARVFETGFWMGGSEGYGQDGKESTLKKKLHK